MAAVSSRWRILQTSFQVLNLDVIAKCGQSFRWQKVPPESDSDVVAPPEWRLALSDRVVCLRQSPLGPLSYRAYFASEDSAALDDEKDSTLVWLKDYFQLDIDLPKVFSETKDPILHEAVARFGGIRILRQDPWENLISFICSQNNHISRITSMVQNLCTHFSSPLLAAPLPITEQPYHAFPPPEALADPSIEATLRGLGFGYRAKYIQKTAAFLCEKHADPQTWLLGLRKAPTEEARAALLELSGVGPKVADCILLMSLDKHEVVPVDTHILQIAMKHYNFRVPGYSGKSTPPMTPKLHTEISTRLQNLWGPYAGWAQTVLFTADLKSFEGYGKSNVPPTPSTTSELPEAIEKDRAAALQEGLAPPPRRKRKAGDDGEDIDSTSVTVSYRRVKKSSRQSTKASALLTESFTTTSSVVLSSDGTKAEAIETLTVAQRKKLRTRVRGPR